MRSCAFCKTLLRKLRLRGFVRCRCGWIARATGAREMKEVVMAKVIQFYIPARFRKPLNTPPQVRFGKLVEFCLPTKKSA
jgi:hypothetical protein